MITQCPRPNISKHIEVASDPIVTVGAVSENFVTFQAGQTYTAGNIVPNWLKSFIEQKLHIRQNPVYRR